MRRLLSQKSEDPPLFCKLFFIWYLENIIKMTLTNSKAKQKVAIVGSGMAGLVIAHLLHHDLYQRYSVTVFESVRMSQMLPFAGLKIFRLLV
jgi:NADPH-dependent 2,4-dienoyl-CoA reductase/sulfur reductase-like enzyme